VIVGAHYDAQGQHDSDVFPGADDNASGVAAILEIARISAMNHSGVNMVFVAFGAEERGLLGAKAYVNAPSVLLSRVTLMINLDMVGRPLLDGSPMRYFVPRSNETLGYILGNVDKPRIDDILQRAAEKEDRPIVGIPEIVLTRLGFGSDSVPFSPFVPTIFLSTGDHADYHKPTDTPEKIDFDQVARAVRLSLAMIHEIDEVASPKAP
jgi:Zn-dependent M28 family amino/carboxypeptidase